MNFEDLKNPELQGKLMSIKTSDELLALAKEEGVELTDDQLEAISGGWATDDANNRDELMHRALPIY